MRRPDVDKRDKIVGLLKAGHTYRQIVELADTSMGLVTKVIKLYGGVVPKEKKRSELRLSFADREEISRLLSQEKAYADIARALGRPTSTISREVNKNGGKEHYRAGAAEKRAQAQARRPKPAKLATSARLRTAVETLLVDHKCSPRQISQRLRSEHPDDTTMWVSHETIYQSLFIQGRGALRRELTACLRTGRAHRRPQRREVRSGPVKNMVMISQRPAEVGDRAVPGHWEGDLIMGKNNASAIGTLVERSTRYVMLMKLKSQKAETVREALAATVQRLPDELFKTLTWDQGSEMAQHRRFSIDSGVQVYFCDPHSPWQRGSNENTNGLLRQYFPKGTVLSGHSQDDLDAVSWSLNGRPRETLDWKTPLEKLTELLR